MPLDFRRRHRAARRRRAILILVGLIAAAIYIVAIAKSSTTRTEKAAPPEVLLRVTSESKVLAVIPARRYLSRGRVDRAKLTALLTPRLPKTKVEIDGRVRTVYSYDREATITRAVRLGSSAGNLAAVRHITAATVRAPAIKQRLRNNCESAALSILLATTGRNVDQLRIQRALPKSGSLDPIVTDSGTQWGDPNIGFVGRADGGGTAGGFGVYPPPVAATARRLRAPLKDLTGKPPSAVYESLREGHAVMAWIGLTTGPIKTWTTPNGRSITVNFGEHTVVLHGITPDGELIVSNPLEGTRERWTQKQFEQLWARLGRRALTTETP